MPSTTLRSRTEDNRLKYDKEFDYSRCLRDTRTDEFVNQPAPLESKVLKLWDCHHEIFRLALLGHQAPEIGDFVGLSAATVKQILNSPIGRRHLAVLRAARDHETIDIAREVRQRIPKALAILDQVLDSEDARLQDKLKVAFELIDHQMPKTVREEHLHAHFTADDIRKLKDLGNTIGVISNDTSVIEGEILSED